MRGTIGSATGMRVVVTGVLEVRSAQDGRLGLVVTPHGRQACVALELPPDLVTPARARILRRVSVGGRLHRAGDRRVLCVEWLQPAGLPRPR
ncbi:hypothetical protein ACWEOE_37615 [Amycolatopsis sp. NPDC004368]